MRYSKQKSTGILLESQSGGDLDNPLSLETMVSNLVDGGFDKDDIEVGYCTDKELEDMIEAQKVALDLSHPLQKWERDIAKTDSGMPRYLEDHITDGHDGDAGNEFLQVKYDAKIKLRATKP